ncbi:hypothetical protein [Colwellia echini]|nr:hypothetical protein [Colwellia echini]
MTISIICTWASTIALVIRRSRRESETNNELLGVFLTKKYG